MCNYTAKEIVFYFELVLGSVPEVAWRNTYSVSVELRGGAFFLQINLVSQKIKVGNSKFDVYIYMDYLFYEKGEYLSLIGMLSLP